MAGMGEEAGRLLCQIDQVGAVVEDIDLSVALLTELGVGDWVIWTIGPREVEVRGKLESISMRIALAQVGAMQLELIQPLEGNSVHVEHLTTKGEGLHHLGAVVSNMADRVATMQALGIGVLQTGGKQAASNYMDTIKSVGFILELIDLTPNWLRLVEKVRQKCLDPK